MPSFPEEEREMWHAEWQGEILRRQLELERAASSAHEDGPVEERGLVDHDEEGCAAGEQPEQRLLALRLLGQGIVAVPLAAVDIVERLRGAAVRPTPRCDPRHRDGYGERTGA